MIPQIKGALFKLNIMDKLIARNYQANVNKGVIKPDTLSCEFLRNIHKKNKGVVDEYYKNGETPHLAHMLSDAAGDCINWMIQMGFDPVKVFEKMVIENENRVFNS